METLQVPQASSEDSIIKRLSNDTNILYLRFLIWQDVQRKGPYRDMEVRDLPLLIDNNTVSLDDNDDKSLIQVAQAIQPLNETTYEVSTKKSNQGTVKGIRLSHNISLIAASKNGSPYNLSIRTTLTREILTDNIFRSLTPHQQKKGLSVQAPANYEPENNTTIALKKDKAKSALKDIGNTFKEDRFRQELENGKPITLLELPTEPENQAAVISPHDLNNWLDAKKDSKNKRYERIKNFNNHPKINIGDFPTFTLNSLEGEIFVYLPLDIIDHLIVLNRTKETTKILIYPSVDLQEYINLLIRAEKINQLLPS